MSWRRKIRGQICLLLHRVPPVPPRRYAALRATHEGQRGKSGMMKKRRYKLPASAALCAVLALTLAGCESGDHVPDTGAGAGTAECSGDCATENPTFLSVADVETILAQAIVEANAQNADATIAVVDRVGNVLGVFRMDNADQDIKIDSGRAINTGLDGIPYIPDTLVAIAKAITGAY